MEIPPELIEKRVKKVAGLGDVLELEDSLVNKVSTCQELGIPAPYLTTPEQVARIRLAGITPEIVSEFRPSWTSMGVVGMKDKPTILIKHSPVLTPWLLDVGYIWDSDFLCGVCVAKTLYERAERRADVETKTNVAPEDRTACIVPEGLEIIVPEPQKWGGLPERTQKVTPELDIARFILGKACKEYFSHFGYSAIPLSNPLNKDVPEKFANVGVVVFSPPMKSKTNSAIYDSQVSFACGDFDQCSLSYVLPDLEAIKRRARK